MVWFLCVSCAMGIANAHDVYYCYKDFPFIKSSGFNVTLSIAQLMILDYFNIIDMNKKYMDGRMKQIAFHVWRENCRK